jgi:hypothetical protein
MQGRQWVGTYGDIIADHKNARQHPAYPRASQVDAVSGGEAWTASPSGIAFTHWRHTSERPDTRPLSPTHQVPLASIGPRPVSAQEDCRCLAGADAAAVRYLLWYLMA